ncbi:MAG: NAD(P)-binding protein, partial [Parvularculaceae bacterium]|nr:NAD(P)-binding protein [Parvularculaceae bacterium]
MHTTGQPYRKHKGIEGSFDTIVVGSGMGGMTAAVMLAKQGRSVLLLEQNSVVGGLTQSYSRGGYRWNTGLHYIGDVGDPNRVTHRLFSYLTDDAIQWAPLPQVYNKMAIADRVYDIPAGKNAFGEALKTWFPNEAEAIETYLDLVSNVNRTSNTFFAQKALPEKVAVQFLDQAAAPFFEHANKLTIDALHELTQD